MHINIIVGWPNVVIQFGDFETSKAVPLLDRYRYKVVSELVRVFGYED